jgi:hypothetical protein
MTTNYGREADEFDALVGWYYTALGSSGNTFKVIRLVREAYTAIVEYARTHPAFAKRVPPRPILDADDAY